MKCRDCNHAEKGYFKSVPEAYVCIGVKEPFVIGSYVDAECKVYKNEKEKIMANKDKEVGMKLLIKERGKGKTTSLIYTSEVTGYPIVTFSSANVSYIKSMAEKMGCKIPEPLTVNELREKRIYAKVLVDDAETILGEALSSYLGCNVECATISYCG